MISNELFTAIKKAVDRKDNPPQWEIVQNGKVIKKVPKRIAMTVARQEQQKSGIKTFARREEVVG